MVSFDASVRIKAVVGKSSKGNKNYPKNYLKDYLKKLVKKSGFLATDETQMKHGFLIGKTGKQERTGRRWEK